MGLWLLPKLIALTHWNAGLFQALAVALEHEQSRQLTECSAIDLLSASFPGRRSFTLPNSRLQANLKGAS
jgi:hypothetical protein